MGTVFAVIAALFMKQYILVSERNDPRYAPHIHLRDWAYGKADCITVQTTDCIELFNAKVRRKAIVIPNPIGADIPQRYTGTRTKKIVNAARLHKQKNHRLLLEAFADFTIKHPDYELHIYGKGELEERLKEIAVELKIEKNVIFKGFSNNVKEEIKDSSMFVLSSNFEGISNSLIEAMAMGVPVISTDCPIGGSKMYIEDGVNGLLVPIGQREKMTGAMCRIAEDESLAEQLSQNGEKIKEKYSISMIADAFLDAIQFII